MSIQDLFNRKTISIESAASGSKTVESRNFIIESNKKKRTFIPNIDFNTASNFAKFGSAYEYYTKAVERIYDQYPYDGSDREKIVFELSSSYLDKWIFDKNYPKSTGYVKLSYGGWGSLNGSITSDGYGLPSSVEYIYSRGGLHTASVGMIGTPLAKTFDKSVKYDSSKNRATTFVLDLNSGFTVEFWLKKDSFDLTKTKKEVILDLWNGQVSSSANYGRFTLELSGTWHDTETFRVTLQSGTSTGSVGGGFFDQTIGTSTVTTSSLGSWKHYALSFKSASAGVTSRLYVNGDLNEKKNLGTSGFGTIGGLINGYIGALQTRPSGSAAPQYAGKLDAYLDDFRFWKTRRSSQDIYNNYYTHVGGGTNTDDANTTLGLYYKFNEGITGKAGPDSVVLDYSGRIANGTWTGYSSGARNVGSAFVSSSTVTSEPADPIIRKNHPSVVALLSELQTSGSEWDDQNTSLLYNRVPAWIREEDEDDNKNVKYLIQVIGSYFDSLYQQIAYVPRLKEKQFFQGDYKAIPFADRLLLEKGITTSNILVDQSLFETYNDRDVNKVIYEKQLSDIKNLIYTNIYNNLDFIYKSKGTETSIRNMLRCFGVDDEIVKLNVYTDGGIHYFKDNHKQTVLNTNYINFNSSDMFAATIYQTSSLTNANNFITGSRSDNEIYSAFTTEANIIVPYKIKQHEDGHFATPFISSSIFGMHEAKESPTLSDYSWPSTEIANFQVYLVRNKQESDAAEFVLKSRDGSLHLTSSLIRDIYDNHNWNVAVRIKPDKYPFLGNVLTSSSPTYTIDFYGATHAYSTLANSFHVSASLSYASGSAFLTRPKRLYAGSHRTNFTGSYLQRTDIKIGSLAYYQDYLDNDIINQHNLDPSNYGTMKSFSTPTMFFKGAEKRQVPSFDTKALLWNFATVTGSNSGGTFMVDDYTSGSSTFNHNWPDKITKAYHPGRGFGFPASNTSFIKNELVYSNKKELPEISYTSDNVLIEDDKVKHFIKDEDVSDNYYALEKSMYQVVSEEMINMFSSVKEFSNLIGKATDRYRIEYKRLNFIRSLFFEKVEQDMDFDKFTNYFKWIDDSVSLFVSQLFPATTRHSKDISDIVESHVLERNKYQNKFPHLNRYPSTEGQIKGSSELRYNWERGHAPIPNDSTAIITIATPVTVGDTLSFGDGVSAAKTYEFVGSSPGANQILRVATAVLQRAYIKTKLEADFNVSITTGGSSDPYMRITNKNVILIPESIYKLSSNFTAASNKVSGFTKSNPENKNCLWQKHRNVRSDISGREDLRRALNAEVSASVPNLSKVDNTIYRGSEYAFRNLSRPYKISQDLKPPIHGGINYSPQKDRDFVYHATQRHGKKGNFWQPLNVMIAGVGPKPTTVPQQKCDDVIDPNLKEKIRVEVYVGRYADSSYEPGPLTPKLGYHYITSEKDWPVNIVTGSVRGGYQGGVDIGFHSGAIITNIHSDTTTPENHIPMQGPFTEAWVGGHQHRHVELNRYNTSLRDDDTGGTPPNNLHNKYTREEAWRLAFANTTKTSIKGAMGFVGPDYGGPYPDPAKKVAVLYREERAKRPLNIKNIQYTTASSRLGNFKENYEIISSVGRNQNNLYLKKNPAISNYVPQMTSISSELTGGLTHVLTTIAKIADTTRHGNTFGSGSNLKDEIDYQHVPGVPLINGKKNRTVITTRFSAPGGIETSYSYLDVYSREYSVHNNLNYRNLTVRGRSSGEAGRIRADDHIGNRDGLRTHLSRHCGKAGRDSSYGALRSTSFERTGSHVTVDNNTILWFNLIGSQNGTGQSTHSAWIKVNDLNSPYYIFDYGIDKYSAYINSAGRVVVKGEGWTGTKQTYFTSPSNTITANKYHHVAIVMNTASSPQPIFYIDGALIGTSKLMGADSSGLFQPANGLTIGARNKGGGYNMNGQIDEFVVWSRQLNATQIQNIHAAGRASKLVTVGFSPYDDLELWYKMGDEDDSVHQIFDRSGKKRHSFKTENLRFVVDDDTSPSLHKQHRNRSLKPNLITGSLLSPLLTSVYDNGFVSSPIPRTEYQYSWIKASLENNYSVLHGKQRLYGYAPADGILSSSVEIDGNSGFVEAINFPSASELYGE